MELQRYIEIENTIPALADIAPIGAPTVVAQAEDLKASLAQFEQHVNTIKERLKDTEYAMHRSSGEVSFRIGWDWCHVRACAQTLDPKRTRRLSLFEPSAHIQETYGLSPFGVYFYTNSDVPYYGTVYAQKVGDTFKSLLVADDGLPWEETMAKRIMDDPEVKTTVHPCAFDATDSDGWVDGANYLLPYTNKDSTIFKPTVYQPISDACNVDSNAVIEVLLTFEEGYMVPVLHTVKTGGFGAMSMADITEDILRTFDGDWDEIEDFFADCGNYTKFEGKTKGFSLYACTEGGETTKIEFYHDRESHSMLKRAITSIRLVRLDEVIKTR